MKTIYIIVRHFTQDSGSYAGMVEQFSKYASSHGFKTKILCCRKKNNLKPYEKLPYAEVVRFEVPDISIPPLGMNLDYILLSRKVKRYFKTNPPDKEDIFIANGRAALGILDKGYILRMSQPAMIFLKNMEIAKDEVSFLTRTARAMHFYFQYLLEKKVVKHADKMISSSVESRDHVVHYYGKNDIVFFTPHSGVKYSELQSPQTAGDFSLLFISAGTEKIRKGVIYLERALPMIFNRYPKLKLIHVGKKFEWDVPKKYKKRIRCVGRVPWSEMKKYYKKNNILVNNALNEWIPNIVFEAMAAGSPIITCDSDGMHQTLIHKKEAYIYKRADVKGLRRAVSYMIDNPKKTHQMASRAKEKVKSIDYDLFSQELLRFIQDNYCIDLLNSCRIP